MRLLFLFFFSSRYGTATGFISPPFDRSRGSSPKLLKSLTTCQRYISNLPPATDTKKCESHTVSDEDDGMTIDDSQTAETDSITVRPCRFPDDSPLESFDCRSNEIEKASRSLLHWTSLSPPCSYPG